MVIFKDECEGLDLKRVDGEGGEEIEHEFFLILNFDWRASEASETLSRVYKFEQMRYIYILLHRY